MESHSNRTLAIAIVVAVIALLLGLCGGAVVGGIAGFAVGRAERNGGGAGPFPQPQLTPGFPFPSTPGSSVPGAVTVQDVVANSPAEQAGIQTGDVITAVDNVSLDATHTLTGILGQHKPGDRVRLTIERGGAENSVTVRLSASPSDANRAYLGIRYTSSTPTNPTPAP